MPRLLFVLLALSACSPSHPLTYVKAGDPIWAINPDQWTPPGGNLVTPPPAPQSGRLVSAR